MWLLSSNLKRAFIVLESIDLAFCHVVKGWMISWLCFSNDTFWNSWIPQYFPNSWSALSNRRWQNEVQQASPRCEIISRHQPYSKSMLIHWILKVMTSRNVNVWRSSIGFRITYLNRLTSCLSCIRQKRMTVS